MSYKTSIEPFPYYPVRHCAIERYTSIIASNTSFDYEFAKCGRTDDLIAISHEIKFDLVHQVFMHVFPDIVGLLGDKNGDSGTIRTGLSDATVSSSKTVSPTPINYLKPSLTQPSPNVSTIESQQTNRSYE